MQRLLVLPFCLALLACDAEDVDEPIRLGPDNIEDGRGYGASRAYASLNGGIGGYFAVRDDGSNIEVQGIDGLAVDSDPVAAEPSGPLWEDFQDGAKDWVEDAGSWWCENEQPPPKPWTCDDLCGEIGPGWGWSGDIGVTGAKVYLSQYPTVKKAPVTVTKPQGLGPQTFDCSADEPCLFGPLSIDYWSVQFTPECSCFCVPD